MFPDNYCPRAYTSQLPKLTTSLTVSVYYYYPYDYVQDSGLPWPYRVGFTTTTVLSESWPTLAPAATTPNLVLASHLVIRWKDSDFQPTSAAPAASNGPSGTPPLESMGTEPDMTSMPSSTPLDVPKDGQAATTTGRISACSTCNAASVSPSPSGPLSQGGIAIATVTTVLGTVALVLGVLLCYYRQRRGSKSNGIELDHPGPNVGCLTLYKDESDPGPIAE